MTTIVAKGAGIPIPLGGFQTIEDDALWLTQTIALRVAQGLTAMGVSVPFEMPGLYGLVHVMLQQACQRALREIPDNVRAWRQTVVADWVLRCWGEQVLASGAERGGRLFEEAAETAQAVGLPLDKARHILEYVYARPPGDPAQEIGGVGVTLLALAASLGLSADACERAEVARVLAKPVEHFRRRHAEKEEAGVMVTQQAPRDDTAVEIAQFLRRAPTTPLARSEDGTVFGDVAPTPATIAEEAAHGDR